MNYFEYQEAVFASTTLTFKARLTALAIASYYNWKDQSPCWPSDALLSQRTGLSISSITRAKKELVADGYLSSDRRYDSTNEYVPLLPVTVPLLTQSTPSAHTDESLCSQGATNREENHEVNEELNNEEELEPQAAPAAGNSDEFSLNEELDVEVTFSKIIGPDGPLAHFKPFVPASLTTDEEWVSEREAAQAKDELDELMDEYERDARVMPDYDPEVWQDYRAKARAAYESGVYAQRAAGIGMGAVT